MLGSSSTISHETRWLSIREVRLLVLLSERHVMHSEWACLYDKAISSCSLLEQVVRQHCLSWHLFPESLACPIVRHISVGCCIEILSWYLLSSDTLVTFERDAALWSQRTYHVEPQ